MKTEIRSEARWTAFSLAFIAMLSASRLHAADGVTLENDRFVLRVGSDCAAESLVLKANGEELLEPGEGIPFCTTTQDRPFNNEIKLIHPNKRTTYPANRIRREGGRLVVGFETAPYEAVVEVRAGKGFVAFALADWIVKPGAAGYEGHAMDSPPVADFRLVQLPVRRRANLGDWLNSAWDERGGVAVLAADPYVDADHEERARCRLLSADLHRGIELTGGTAAIALLLRQPLLLLPSTRSRRPSAFPAASSPAVPTSSTPPSTGPTT